MSVIYDYAYFNQQFKNIRQQFGMELALLVMTTVVQVTTVVKVAGVTNFSYNPTGTEKVIFLINGDVTIKALIW